MSVCDGLLSLSHNFPRLRILCEETGDPPVRIVLRLIDSLDNDSSVPFVKEFERLLDLCPSLNTLHLNASGLRYLSSTGVGAIASALMCAQRHRVDFLIVDPSPHVSNLFKLLGFEKFLPIQRTGSPV